MKKIVYPRLTPHFDFGFIRFGGPGLANCMIISARAYIFAKKNNYEYISPTWVRFGTGPILRKEKDSRFYLGLFKKVGISGIKKIFFLLLSYFGSKKIEKVDNLGKLFIDLKENYVLSSNFLKESINKNALRFLDNENFNNVIGLHIRCGDYKNSSLFTDLSFYKEIILKIKNLCNNKYKFYIFSDGSDDELKDILSINGVTREFFGNAVADMIALSKCRMIIASDSTFSGMAAFLEQKPIIFPKRHFGSVLEDKNKDKEIVFYSSSEENIESFFMRNL